MNYVDKKYLDLADEIINHGYSEEDVKNADVRPRWKDGSKASAIYLPQAVVRYPEGTTPLLSLRKIAWKTAIKEILWIYQDKSNDVNLLKEKYHVNYWDSWTNEEGNLGTAYGYQINKKIRSERDGSITNQIDRLIDGIKNKPLDRRHFTTLLSMEDLADMTLVPCAFMTMWTVREDKLDLTLIQRSGDFLAAAAPGGINAFQYYALLVMVAKVTGYKPGNMVHFVQNLHIYNRHVEIAKEVCMKYDENRPMPRLKIKDHVDDFYKITIDDFILEDYEPDTTEYEIEIAI